MKTAYFSDPLFLKHDTGRGHPESAARLEAILARLSAQSYWGDLIRLLPGPATTAEIALIHSEEYARQVALFCQKGGGYLDGDTPVSRQSYDAALLAAGSGLRAADAIHSGEIERALLLVRPPGHHSLMDRAMGFCIFNNIAITARYLQKIGFERIAIYDWDVHHGNGTQAVFYEDPSVLFISTHQFPFYPGSGAENETGAGRGKGFTLNIPLPAHSGESTFRLAFSEKILPALKEFCPDILLISAGFDGHSQDPLAMLELRTESYAWMTSELVGFAREFCQGRIISFLEGGYNLSALSDSVEAHLAVLSE